MAEAPQNITILKQISSKFNALSNKCPVFYGNGDIHIEYLLEDVQYCHDTGKSSNQEMLQCLLYHLEGQAKSFTRIIKQKTWHSVTSQLRQHFGFSAVEQFQLRAKLHNTKQDPTTTFQEYAINLQQQARLTVITEEDLVNIAIHGVNHRLFRTF